VLDQRRGPPGPPEATDFRTGAKLSTMSSTAFVPSEPAKPPIVSVRGVTMRFPITKRYREIALHPLRRRRVFTALTGASLEVEPGDRIAVLGPNGAGKTTLLRLIGGLLLPTEGEVVINGFNTQRHSTRARKCVGFVMNEERSFFWRLTAEQNLEFFGALDGLWGADLKARTRELLRLVGLEASASRLVSDFSSGMKQKLALARGLIADPEVLILDEPTRALDPVAADEMARLILDRIHRDTRKTLLIATHRLEEISTLCTKVVVIAGGKLKAFDRVADIVTSGASLLEYYRRHVLSQEKS
jgi:ABC-2 type transport system ATP-binding protein